MKKGTMVLSAILLAIAIDLYWFSGFWMGFIMTLVLGAIMAFDLILLEKRNPRWWLVILILIVSIFFIRGSYIKLIDNECNDDTVDIVKETYIEELEIK